MQNQNNRNSSNKQTAGVNTRITGQEYNRSSHSDKSGTVLSTLPGGNYAKEEEALTLPPVTLYVGIDVHKSSWSITMRAAGQKIKTMSITPSPQALADQVRKHFPGIPCKSVYEAGFCGFWVHRKLCSLGIENIVINPGDVPTTGKERGYKTDEVDSAKLARELEYGTLTPIYIPTVQQETFRSLCRHRTQCVRDMVKTKNRIKSFLYTLGTVLPPNNELQHWSGAFLRHLEELPITEPGAKERLRLFLEHLSFQRKQILDTVRYFRGMIKKDKDLSEIIDCLCTVPGVGFLTACMLVGELADIKRFKTVEHLNSYVGFIPSMYSSGEKERSRGMNYRHLPYLRYWLVESAWVAIKCDENLLTLYHRYKHRMGAQKAIIRIAKRLVFCIMVVWEKRKPYVSVPSEKKGTKDKATKDKGTKDKGTKDIRPITVIKPNRVKTNKVAGLTNH